ncbi:hypothetical protein HDU67_002982 [Dinochytrium kinnereticum]|nr:hypothetical protein HDU67_002982 [Dinochytrium kinnereticum]
MPSQQIFKSKLQQHFQKSGTLAVTGTYPPVLTGTSMTREAFDKRIQFINDTAGKSLVPMYTYFIPMLLWVVGIIATMVVGIILPDGCASYDYKCSSKAFLPALGIILGSMVVIILIPFIAQCGLRKTEDILENAMMHLNNVDSDAGFSWDYDVYVKLCREK